MTIFPAPGAALLRSPCALPAHRGYSDQSSAFITWSNTVRTMPSERYVLFVRAMLESKRIHCRYDGFRRELCPILLGYTNEGEEGALAYQVAGESESRLPPGGDWRYLVLARIKNPRLRAGRCYAASEHRKRQTFLAIVDFDVNPSSPYQPRYSLEELRRELGRQSDRSVDRDR